MLPSSIATKLAGHPIATPAQGALNTHWAGSWARSVAKEHTKPLISGAGQCEILHRAPQRRSFTGGTVSPAHDCANFRHDYITLHWSSMIYMNNWTSILLQDSALNALAGTEVHTLYHEDVGKSIWKGLRAAWLHDAEAVRWAATPSQLSPPAPRSDPRPISRSASTP